MLSMASSVNQMREPFVGQFVLPFLSAKSIASRISAAGKPQRKLPEFGQPKSFQDRLNQVYALSKYMSERLFYKSDPWYYDHYTHPMVLQEAIERHGAAVKLHTELKKRALQAQEKQVLWEQICSEMGISCDCDDYAAWSSAVLIKMGFKNQGIYNLLVKDQIKDVQWNHVIHLFELGTEDSDRVPEPWVGCLDTNGLNWFQVKNGDVNKQVRDHFGRIYNAPYAQCIPVDMPFDELRKA